MRDIQITSSTYNNRLSRHLSFLEEFAGLDGQAKIEKNWIYTLKDKVKISNRADVCQWAKKHKKKDKEGNFKFFSLLKTHNSKLGESGLNLTVVGDMQVVRDGYIFLIEYFYSFRVYVKERAHNEKNVNGLWC